MASDLLKTRFHCPSLAYWATVLSLIPVTLVVMLVARTYLIRKTKRRVRRIIIECGCCNGGGGEIS